MKVICFHKLPYYANIPKSPPFGGFRGLVFLNVLRTGISCGLLVDPVFYVPLRVGRES